MHKKTFAFAEVKAAADSTHPNGEFEVILSAQTLDRDGEVIDAKAFEPLPDSIPFHAFHDFNDPIGRGVPFYDGDVLKARGVFASTPRAQEIRTLVSEGVIGHTSVGFMAATCKDADDGVPHITKGELLEGSFVSVPANREAAVLAAKEFDIKAAGGFAPRAVRKAHGMTANELRDALERAVREAHGAEDAWTWVRDYADTWVVYEVSTDNDYVCWQEGYTVANGVPTLAGGAVEVVAHITYVPANPATPAAPETPAEEPASREAPAPEAGKSPASEVVDRLAATRVEAFLLSVED